MRATGILLILCILGITIPGCTGGAKDANAKFSSVGSKLADAKKEAAPRAESAPGAPTLKPDMMGDYGVTWKRSTDKAKSDVEKTAGGAGSEGVTIADVSESMVASTKVAPTTPAPATPPPAVAEPVVGRETPKMPKQPQVQSGILTAGSFDDNINPQVFNSFVRRFSQNRGLGDFPAKMQGQRLMVIVKDGAGKPVGDARVRLSGGASAPVELPTRSDGRAVFLLPLDQLPNDQALLASEYAPHGGAPRSPPTSTQAPHALGDHPPRHAGPVAEESRSRHHS